MNKNGKPTPEELLHYQVDQFKEALYEQMEPFMKPFILSISKIVNKLFP